MVATPKSKIGGAKDCPVVKKRSAQPRPAVFFHIGCSEVPSPSDETQSHEAVRSSWMRMNGRRSSRSPNPRGYCRRPSVSTRFQGFRVRRASLVAVLVGGGALFSLPFRRAAVPKPVPPDQGQQELLSDQQIELLVRDITQDVRPPTVYDPQTDYLPTPSPRGERTMPLSYHDLAVPVEEDPFYAKRFNATKSVSQRNVQLRTAKEIADVSRRFDLPAAQSVGPLPNNQLSAATHPVQSPDKPAGEYASPKTVSPNNVATRLPGQRNIEPSQFSHNRPDQSILSQLPPPDSVFESGEEANQDRKKYWIRQPD